MLSVRAYFSRDALASVEHGFNFTLSWVAGIDLLWSVDVPEVTTGVQRHLFSASSDSMSESCSSTLEPRDALLYWE